MKTKILLSVLCVFIFGHMLAQSDARIVLKKDQVITGKIVEIKPGSHVGVEMFGSVVQIPYADVSYIILDPNFQMSANNGNSNTNQKGKKESGMNNQPAADWVFESINEGVVSVGVGAVEGINGSYVYDPIFGQVIYLPPAYDGPNADVFGGVYTANGVSYKGKYFAGIGIGAMGHSGYDGDFTMPFAVDLRARIFSDKRISPYFMLASGITYHKGGVGSFDFVDGAGVSLRIHERLNAHALLSHTYTRFYGKLSAGSASSMLDGMYLNYFGLRAGVSFRF
ncbi:MAG: hypothetical protein ACK5HD_04060 [Bacteroidota bacterium]|jgi:hypothetical protein